MHLRSIVLSVALGAIAVTGVWARQAGPAQLALEAARKVEVVDRDLKGAAVRYRDVVATYPKDRAVAPEALLALAGCLEQLGKPPEARAAYERVVKEYPNTAPARAAQKKLAAFPKEGSGLTSIQIDGDSSGAPSLDGGYMSFSDRDSGDLAVRDLKSGQARTVSANPPGTVGWPVATSVPSPDGRQIAYVWEGDREDLRVISSKGGPPKVICCADQAPDTVLRDTGVPITFTLLELFGWSMDGQNLLFALVSGTRLSQTTQISTIPAGGGARRVLKTIEGSVEGASWSPDGRFIIYDAPRMAGKPEHALFVMRADGSNSAVLIPHAFNDEMLDWFPDGKRILFVSDRNGAKAIFSQHVADGKAVGEPYRLKEDLGGKVIGQGFTRDGSYYYSTVGKIEQVLTFRLDASGELSEKVVRLSGRFANGMQGAAWSPNGSLIADVQAPFGVSGTQPSLRIQSISSGQVRTVSVALAEFANPAWMPDGLAIIVEGTTVERGQGLFRIDLATEALSPIGETTTGQIGRRLNPVVSLDGREVLYLLDNRSIQARNLDSGIVRMVFKGWAMAFALSPDGGFIAVGEFIEQPGQRVPPVQIIPIAGGTPRALAQEVETGNPGEGIAFSADGRYVWFTRYIGDAVAPLWRVPVNGGPAQRMSGVTGVGGVRRLSAAPNGTMAVSSPGANFQQWVMRNIPPAAKR